MFDCLKNYSAQWQLKLKGHESRSFEIIFKKFELRARAKIIAAEGEAIASRNLAYAAEVLESKEAIELRYLQTLSQVAANDNHTVVFPLPTQILNMLDGSEPINNPIFKRFVEMFQSNDQPPEYEEITAQESTCPLTGVTISTDTGEKTAF